MVPFRQSNGYMSQYMIVYGGYCNGKQSNHLAILDTGLNTSCSMREISIPDPSGTEFNYSLPFELSVFLS